MSLYGDGSDGSITHSSDTTESGRIQATDYTVQSGVTVTVPPTSNNGILIVEATNSITIDGDIIARSTQGGTGGNGATNDTENGKQGGVGEAGDWIGNSGTGGDGGVAGGTTESGSLGSGDGAGGGGGAGAFGLGTDGGDGGNLGASSGSVPSNTKTGAGPWRSDESLENKTGWSDIYDFNVQVASSGTGGGGGGFGENGGNGGDGGDGGDGGGIILLVAPDITVTGNVDCIGRQGQDGEDGTDDSASSGDEGGGGGGGGAGSGGLVYAVTPNQDVDTNSFSVFSYTGGAGGAGPDSGHYGADGLSASDGQIHTHSVVTVDNGSTQTFNFTSKPANESLKVTDSGSTATFNFNPQPANEDSRVIDSGSTQTFNFTPTQSDAFSDEWWVGSEYIIEDTEELANFKSIELQFLVEGDRIDDIRNLATDSGETEEDSRFDGQFQAFTQVTGNTYYITPPRGRKDVSYLGTGFVEDYTEEREDTRGNEFRVTLELLQESQREPSSGLVTQSRDTDEWLFEFGDPSNPEGAIATSFIDAESITERVNGIGSFELTVSLTYDQTQVIREVPTRLYNPDGDIPPPVEERETRDASDITVDNTTNQRNTVTVTAPSGGEDILASDEYVVVSWETEWVGRYYEVSMVLGR